MSLGIGIVGLPNVGKSTLFNALSGASVLAANYPFATKDPNIGIVPVPDERLTRLSALFKPKKTTPAALEFVDIAGLVRGASKGEGLGNQFLANIRETNAIAQVLRCFRDGDVVHVDGDVDPERDAGVIDTELLLKDLEAVEKRRERTIKMTKAVGKPGEEARAEVAALDKLKVGLNAGLPVRALFASDPRSESAVRSPTASLAGGGAEVPHLSDDERALVKDLWLLTAKPTLFVANVSEPQLGKLDTDPDVAKARAVAAAHNAPIIEICAQVEAEIQQLPLEERAGFLESVGLAEPGLNKLVRAAYKLLGLQSYFTAGEDECRAWTIPVGARAPQAAGVIHTDFERGFIKAEVMHLKDLLELGSEGAVKERGLMRMEGKEYVVHDGDVMHFRFNV